MKSNQMKWSSFLQNKWLGKGKKTINTLQVSAQNKPTNVIKVGLSRFKKIFAILKFSHALSENKNVCLVFKIENEF